ncbi:hypothetical protein EVAR_18625_1 [Eumeta japonica]|uniref:Uncharacterized protein n=1 Tax=Eumeta variegata TaxID=151549 RepID=A0A4C1U7T9_EUMVA|nr:hypothetical protein EVAR_18625_1 [Eumeta japonica]
MASDPPSQDSSNSPCSDNEIFLGKLSLKEIKQRFLDRQTIACPYISTQNEVIEVSVRIIETNSEPDLTSNSSSNKQTTVVGKTESSYSEKCVLENSSNATFIENMANKVQYLPKTNNEELDLINLYYGNEDITDLSCETGITSNNILFSDLSLQNKNLKMNVETPQKPLSCHQQSPIYQTPSNIMDSDLSTDEERYFETPLEQQIELKTEKQPLQTLKHPIQKNLFNTKNNASESTNNTAVNPFANQNKILDNAAFKTPAKLPIVKSNLVSSLKKTSKKCKKFEHIASPIAAYIKNSPQVPLLKEVKPKKQLVAVSGIPKFKDTLNSFKQTNKENVNLPEIAYRSAKKTKVIDNQDEPRMPQSSRVKKLLSSLPRPVVMRHDHRENTTNTKTLCRPEDSFGDLSLHQADLSVCIKKSAMSPTPLKPKK